MKKDLSSENQLYLPLVHVPTQNPRTRILRWLLASMSSSDNTTTSYMKCEALADDSTLALCVVWWIALIYNGHRVTDSETDRVSAP